MPATALVRSSRRFIRQHSELAPELQLTLELCAGYDLRIGFQFVKQKGQDAIPLEGVGTHDEVY